MEIKKLYRITLEERNNNKRTITTWATSKEQIEEDVKKLLPFSQIESIEEVTSETLKVKTV